APATNGLHASRSGTPSYESKGRTFESCWCAGFAFDFELEILRGFAACGAAAGPRAFRSRIVAGFEFSADRWREHYPNEEQGNEVWAQSQRIFRGALSSLSQALGSFGRLSWRMQMTRAVQKIKLSPSRDVPFNKLVLSQSNVRRVKAGVS